MKWFIGLYSKPDQKNLGKVTLDFEPVINTKSTTINNKDCIGGRTKVASHDMLGEQFHYSR